MKAWWLATLFGAAACAQPGAHSSEGVADGAAFVAPETRPLVEPATPSEPAPAVYPGPHWERVSSPEAVGFSTAKLEAVRATLQTLDTTGMMVIVSGRVVLQHGDVERVSYVASLRKSILGMLFGPHVARGEIRETATLAELGIDDVGGLLPEEKQATVADLMASRSGVYHPASNRGDDSKDAPPRGSKVHGTFFLYNNWDFNALGTVFEQATHENVYDALEHELARPVGMEDFVRADQHAERNDAVSIHPAYHMYLSTRDMARLGYLMLRHGAWNGRELLPSGWIAELVAPTSSVEGVRGYIKGMSYGRLWWLFGDPGAASGPFEGAFSGAGAYGQYVTVLPALDMVVTHKVVHKTHEKVDWSTYRSVLERIVASQLAAN